MRKDQASTINFLRLVWIAIWVVAMIPLVASIGCSKSAPPAASGPPFTMPSVGALTETSLRIGDNFPEIQAVDLDGNEVTLDQQLFGERGTLIVFWATWCGFCIQDLPHEIEIAKLYESAGLRVIGVNGDDTTAIAKEAVEEHGVPWLNVFDGPDEAISKELGIDHWPTLLLLGPDGKVVCATPQLRSVTAEMLPDGSTRPVNGLDWTLAELLERQEPTASENE